MTGPNAARSSGADPEGAPPGDATTLAIGALLIGAALNDEGAANSLGEASAALAEATLETAAAVAR
jgi:hypothetical protein